MSTNLSISNNLSVGNSISSTNLSTSNGTINTLNVANLNISQTLNTGNLTSLTTSSIISTSVNTNQMTASQGAIVGNLTFQPSSSTMNYNLSGTNPTHNFANNMNVNGTLNTTSTATIGNLSIIPNSVSKTATYDVSGIGASHIFAEDVTINGNLTTTGNLNVGNLTITPNSVTKIVTYDVSGTTGTTHQFADNINLTGTLTSSGNISCPSISLNSVDLNTRLTNNENNVSSLLTKTTNQSFASNTTTFSGTLSTPAITLNGVNLNTRLTNNENNVSSLLTKTTNQSFASNTTTFSGTLATPAITLNGSDLGTRITNNETNITNNTNNISTLQSKTTNLSFANNVTSISNFISTPSFGNTNITQLTYTPSSKVSMNYSSSQPANTTIGSLVVPAGFSGWVTIVCPISIRVGGVWNTVNTYTATVTGNSGLATITKNSSLWSGSISSSFNTDFNNNSTTFTFRNNTANNISRETYLSTAFITFQPDFDATNSNTYSLSFKLNSLTFSSNTTIQYSSNFNQTQISVLVFFNTNISSFQYSGTNNEVTISSGFLTVIPNNYVAPSLYSNSYTNRGGFTGVTEFSNIYSNYIFTQPEIIDVTNNLNLFPQSIYLSSLKSIRLSNLLANQLLGYTNYITLGNIQTNPVNFAIDIQYNGMTIVIFNQSSYDLYIANSTPNAFDGLLKTAVNASYTLLGGGKVIELVGMANIWVVKALNN